MRVHTAPVLSNQKGMQIFAYGGIFILWLLYLIITLSAHNQITRQHYHLSSTGLHALQIIFSLPVLFIWLAITFAALNFYRYAAQISAAKESRGFRYIAHALGVLLITSILTTYVSSLRAVAGDNAMHTTLENMYIILRNYIGVGGALLAYWWLLRASSSLLGTIKVRLEASKQYVKIWLPFLSLAVLYLSLVFTNPSRRISTNPVISPTFALPDFLILTTVVLPYLIAWYWGCVALLGIYRYYAQTSGIVYKRLFGRLVYGLSTVISLTVALQIISQFSDFLAQSGLLIILAIVVIIYFILIAAYVLVARSAQELNKIELIGAVPNHR